ERRRNFGEDDVARPLLRVEGAAAIGDQDRRGGRGARRPARRQADAGAAGTRHFRRVSPVDLGRPRHHAKRDRVRARAAGTAPAAASPIARRLEHRGHLGALSEELMRILIANEGRQGGGGVETYLSSLVPHLESRGHAVALLYANPASATGPTRVASNEAWSVSDLGLDEAIAAVRGWHPDVCFSHNMVRLDVDGRLADARATLWMH